MARSGKCKRRVIVRAAAAALLALAAGGCGMSNITSSIGGGVFGSSQKKKDAAWTPVVTEETMLAAARSDTGGAMELTTPGTGCPQFGAWPTEKIVTIYDGGRINDSLSVIHRGEITKTARECEIRPNGITVKYGFAGRVLLGPKGKASVVTLPVSVYVMDKARNRLKNETVKVQVQVSPESPVGYFSVVRLIDIPLAPGATAQDYRVFVAFDRNIPGAG